MKCESPLKGASSRLGVDTCVPTLERRCSCAPQVSPAGILIKVGHSLVVDLSA